ncbi:right-handed parallel beta-helix repeat-containing protein [Rubellicoccus peritrichatus]|uniref:Right-handed parallel beta-helix repeat-containing protein n=1 Tax=Rubellicoccus peritrichatus TaxID=3080537 RepID=A0AAQ3LBY9_9BACT|nr:right-handed parallel beta-helix repeat-containing protein [Puniceicoccus sp. CR14]WOO42596.1 right-handed parallel beta-helix repeat-containing protein [Puniceicoccus sp. CR14]
MIKHLLLAILVSSSLLISSSLFALNGHFRIASQAGLSRYVEKTSNTNWTVVRHYNEQNSRGGSIWKITSLGNGYHKIEMGGKALTGSSTQWADVTVFPYSGWSSQQWEITSIGSGYYKIIGKTGKALTGSGSSNGVITEVATYSGWSSQKWKLSQITDTAITNGNWTWIYYNMNRTWNLELLKSNTLVIDCDFHDFATRAIRVENVSNVTILRTKLRNITSDFPLYIINSTNVTVDDCLLQNNIRPAAAHSAFIRVGGGNNVTIKRNEILNADGNAIFNEDCDSLTIDNNVIRTTGRYPFSISAPFHGIYSRSPDALIQNNTISDCRDGSGISVRTTGRILSNMIYDCRNSGIAYWPNAAPGSSNLLRIEYNEVTQGASYVDQTWSSALCIGIFDSSGSTPVSNYFHNFLIANNDCVVEGVSGSNDAVVATSIYGISLPYGYGNIDVMNNILEDQRSVENHLDNESQMDQVSGNSLL